MVNGPEELALVNYRLHCFPESGNSYKVALMLTLCEQHFEQVWTDFGAWVTFSPQWRSTVNAMGEIPVLEEDGVKFTQTGAILLRLAQRYGRFGGTGEDAKYEVLRWLFWDNQRLSAMMAAYRFGRTFAKKIDPPILAFQRARAEDALKVLDEHLKDKAFVTGDEPTIADISLCAYLSFPIDETGYDLDVTHPNIGAWLKRIAQVPGWKSPYALLQGQRLVRYDKGRDL